MPGTEQRLAELTAQVAGLAEQVQGMAQREIAVKTIFDAGFQVGQDDMCRPAPRSARRRSRGRARSSLGAAGSGHLSVVEGGRQ